MNALLMIIGRWFDEYREKVYCVTARATDEGGGCGMGISDVSGFVS